MSIHTLGQYIKELSRQLIANINIMPSSERKAFLETFNIPRKASNSNHAQEESLKMVFDLNEHKMDNPASHRIFS